jgi:AcrR family transcriptional regulator
VSSQVFEAPRQGLNVRQAETVDKLLAAGLDELREVGHEALTIRSVAQRANVSPATAYTYLASKNHLFAELFWRHLTSSDASAAPSEDEGEPVQRVQEAVRHLTARIVQEPELAAAVTPALLGTTPDVERLRLRIGGEFFRRFEDALKDPKHPHEPADPAVLETLILAFSGGLLQAGMGVMTYDQIAERLVSAVDVIMRGN